jgi:sarcosine oxidase, subunit beta
VTSPTRPEYRAVIIGAGIVGLYTAWHLARAGAGPILVVDRGFLSAGASGRNGGGVRQQWETAATVRLARESVEAYRRFPKEFGYNIWFRQSGYLFLAENLEELRRLDSVHRVVLDVGLPTRKLIPEEVPEYAPIRTERIAGATFLATDGTLYPFPAVWGLYEAVRAAGVEVLLGTEVTGISTEGNHVTGVTTTAGSVRTATVVDAAGGWSADVARLAGLTIPNVASRHEILATEPLKPFLNPMVVRL